MSQVVYSNGGGTSEANMRIQIALVILELVVLGGLAGYIHYRYAQLNYPNSSQWKWVLFLSGFIPIATSLATFLYRAVTGYELLLFLLLGGIFSGLISRFLFPHNMRRIYPKRSEQPK